MIRKLLATTAMAVVITAGAAHSQETKTDEGMTMDHAAPVFEMAPAEKSDYNVDGYLQFSEDQVLASTLIGHTIHDRVGDDAEAIGDVNDVVMSKDGLAEAVVVGVGGFLGIAEKDVAVSFDRLNITKADGETWLTFNGTKEELENAPEFERADVVGEAEPVATNRDTSIVAMNEPTRGKVTDPASGADEQRATVEQEATDSREMAANETAPAGAMRNTDGMVAVDQTAISADDLIGTTVHGANDNEIGEISDVIVAVDGEAVKAYIVDVGGFLGIGAKPMAFDASELTIYKDADGAMHIYTSLTEEALEAKPEYSEEAYRDNPDSVLVQ